jgi:hypothetical protein
MNCQFCSYPLTHLPRTDIDDLLDVYSCETCQVDYFYWRNSYPLSKSHHSFIIHGQKSYEWAVTKDYSVLYQIEPIRKLDHNWKRGPMIVMSTITQLTPNNVLQKLKTYLIFS